MNLDDIDIKTIVNSVLDDNDLLKKRQNNIYLSDNDILILEKYGINYMNYSSIKSLIFDIEEILNEECFDDLEELSKKLADFSYYNYTNK